MAFNTFGKIISLTTFGESHSAAIGGVLDGCPANIVVDLEHIQKRLWLRSPASVLGGTQRVEADGVEFLSGFFEGKTIGTPIAFIIRNNNTRSQDYDPLKELYRPSHADYTYKTKYGNRDYRGGGRASARETAVRVLASAILFPWLNQEGISIQAYTKQIGGVSLQETYEKLDLDSVYNSPLRCPEVDTANLMVKEIEKTLEVEDSLGGVICCVIKGLGVGLGEPLYHKLSSQLAAAMFSIPAVKGFEIGSGFQAAQMKGSEHNDVFTKDFKTLSNQSGGIQGGISNGMDVVFNVAFKPVSSIKMQQNTMNSNNEEVSFKIEGRHDVCIVPRAVPIVEAMATLVIADNILLNRCWGH